MVTPELISYIQKKLSEGNSEEIIRSSLLAANWIKEDIESAFTRANEISKLGSKILTDAPSPPVKAKISPLKIIGLGCLGLTVLFFGTAVVAGFISGVSESFQGKSVSGKLENESINSAKSALTTSTPNNPSSESLAQPEIPITPTSEPAASPTKKISTLTPTASLYNAANLYQPTSAPARSYSNPSYACDCSKTCPNLSCDEAQYQLNTCGCSVRDGDHDGIACDVQCQ